MRRQPFRKDMGEAISIEDALSLLTVVFVLFILFMVPLVNVDRMHLVKAQGDTYFQKLTAWLESKGTADPMGAYANAFNMDGHRYGEERDSLTGATWVESLDSSGTLTMVEHDRRSGRFIALVLKGESTVPTYRFGALQWSEAERLWFATSDSSDYGERPGMAEMQKRLRDWTLRSKGF